MASHLTDSIDLNIGFVTFFTDVKGEKKRNENSFQLIGSPALYSLIRRGVGFPWTQSMAVGIPADRKLAEKVSNDRTLGLSKLTASLHFARLVLLV